ncbi:hypothetical protein L798_02065 [Zootermopsis nevadensis]|uniref:Uncharacterized protein n=1 Tax=Zootermopsis nevadensis TaxID=136037 RepID=A0A067REB7_ZOONE|nr:hypothetical protein L798_02065 [Zootermopsis nevadensis]
MTEENLWCRVARSSPLFELLHEHLADHYVIFILEDSTEHNCYAIGFSLDLHSFIISVVNNSSLVTLFTSLLEIKIFLKD